MNDETRSIVAILMGGLLIAITLSGQYTSYVKPGFAPLLLVSGSILAVVGVIRLAQAIRADRHHHTAATGRRSPASTLAEPDQDCHGHPSKTSWMLLAPILILLAAAPPALGADAVARAARSQATTAGPPAATETNEPRRTMPFPPMPTGPNPELTLKEFVLRALYDEADSVTTTPVTVTGFIAGPGQGRIGGYTVARVVINCCAADANPLRFYIADRPPYPENTWVRVVVTAVPHTGTLGNEYVPEATVESLEQIDQPTEPYLT